jgi:hypothetical protein
MGTVFLVIEVVLVLAVIGLVSLYFGAGADNRQIGQSVGVWIPSLASCFSMDCFLITS